MGVGLAMVVGGLGGFALVQWGYVRRRRDEAAVTDPVALEVRRLCRQFGTAVGVGALLVAMLATWWVAGEADRNADARAEEWVECVLAGRGDC